MAMGIAARIAVTTLLALAACFSHGATASAQLLPQPVRDVAGTVGVGESDVEDRVCGSPRTALCPLYARAVTLAGDACDDPAVGDACRAVTPPDPCGDAGACVPSDPVGAAEDRICGSPNTALCPLYHRALAAAREPCDDPAAEDVCATPTDPSGAIEERMCGDLSTALCPLYHRALQASQDPCADPDVGDVCRAPGDPAGAVEDRVCGSPHTALCPLYFRALNAAGNPCGDPAAAPACAAADRCADSHPRLVVCDLRDAVLWVAREPVACTAGGTPQTRLACLQQWAMEDADGLADCRKADVGSTLRCVEDWALGRLPSCTSSQVSSCIKDEVVDSIPSETARCVAGGYDYCDDDDDGLANGEDDCPDDPGAPPTGCPDTDGDGVVDPDDECPTQDGNPRTGCPDSDGDGFEDRHDACPNDPAPGTPNGCPPPPPPPVDDPDPAPTGGYVDDRDDPAQPGDDGSVAPTGTHAHETGEYCRPDAEVEEDCSEPNEATESDHLLLLEGQMSVGALAQQRATAPSLQAGGEGWGMSTQRASDLANAHFRALNVVHLRRVVPWDVALRPFKATACGAQGDPGGPSAEYAETKRWFAEAKRIPGAQITISFGRCKQQGEYGRLPKVSEYKEAVRRFLDNPYFAGVRWFTAWNEPNDEGQPTSVAKRRAAGASDYSGAYRAGQFWSQLNRFCKSADFMYQCSVAAGDFVDSNLLSAAFFNEYRRGMTRQPTVWAYHGYENGASNSFARYDWFRRMTSRSDKPDPPIWLTEQGGIVASAKRGFRGEPRARQDANWLWNTLVARSNRTTRFYYYSTFGASNFDTGLLRGDGSPREMFFDYDNKVAR
jgi:hypothetical protein